MDNASHTRFSIEDRSHLAILKKEIHSLCIGAGFTGQRLGEIDIIVSEMSSNLVKHAVGGEILARVIGLHQPEGIELISIDSGPGIADVEAMLKDGSSTTNTLGNGLGAIKRLSDFLDIYSLPGWGTIILSRNYRFSERTKQKQEMPVGSIVVPKTGELFCGDGFYIKGSREDFQVLMADGLGHGADAHYAVSMAIDTFKKNTEPSPADIIRSLHANIKKTRGIVGTVVAYNTKDKLLKMTGVGNISSRFCGAVNKSSLSYNGIIGSNIPNTINDQEMAIESPQLLVMFSDGIKSGWDYLKYPRILKHDLTILAAAIYKDFNRKTDDSSVIVIRLR